MIAVDWLFVLSALVFWALAPLALIGLVLLAGHLSRPRPNIRMQVVQPLDLDAARDRRRRRRAAA
jgi:hypothetical protein